MSTYKGGKYVFKMLLKSKKTQKSLKTKILYSNKKEGE